jgi:ATP-dependent Clp protease ATP-binding subunit ClpB
MTSNLGSSAIQEMAGEENYDQMKNAVMEVVGQHFRPEFINRVDDVVVFHPLLQAQIRSIADIQLSHLRERLTERDIQFSLTDEALDLIAAEGFDPVYGARPLKRVIQQQLENPLAQDILSGKFNAGDKVRVTVANDKLVFE